ncbi:MAG: hypothetical protein OJF51_003601 [Nitrospira sp.]|nr:MAG: hypothetical protein OJF51_003601 [Nitrospira sp.]
MVLCNTDGGDSDTAVVQVGEAVDHRSPGRNIGGGTLTHVRKQRE